MKWLLLVRPEAERDLVKTRDWYERQRAGLGEEWINEVAANLRDLGHNPELPRLYYLNFRRVIVRRFPYKLFYQVIGHRVIIFRVVHAKQDYSPLLPHT
jgi:plasmid stabilization system protein ParE